MHVAYSGLDLPRGQRNITPVYGGTGVDKMDRVVDRDARIAVLAGGSSSEREVSLQSGANARKALLKAGFTDVCVLDPAEDGFLDTVKTCSAAFLALHGAGGEDGQIQHILDYLGIPYTGSDAFASSCAADKEVSKLLYENADIPVARGVAFKHGETYDVEQVIDELGSCLFVKPAVNGSSYGVSKVRSAEELSGAIERAFDYSDKVLVEECLEGTEITVGVFGDDESLRALPVVEICCPETSDFYDLSVKYIDPTDIHRIPAQLSPADYQRAQELACEAHRALGCFGLSRSDFIVTDRGPVILETNTIPGMTDSSLFPDEVRHEDMKFSDVCADLIEMAAARANAR